MSRIAKDERSELAHIHRIADAMEPKLAAAFEDAILTLRGTVNVNALIAAIASGDDRHVQDILSGLPTHLQSVADVVRDTLTQAAAAFQAPLEARLGASITFDAINPLVVSWMRDNAAALVTAISDETLAALRSVLASASKDGLTSRDVADTLHGSIGLNERQANALYNYWAGLGEQGVLPDDIERMTDDYAERLLSDRADMIARTEIVHAANEAQQQLWSQAAEQGLLDPEATLQEWIATAGACPECDALDGQQVGLDEMFDDDGEDIDQPPEHPNCRCAIGLVFLETTEKAFNPDQFTR